MVTIGFIVEGHSEDILVKSPSFQQYLNDIGLQSSKDLVTNVIGRNNLYRVNKDLENIKERVDDWIKKLHDKGAVIVFIVLDRENSDSCFTEFKSKIYAQPENIIIVAVQAIEAWFLADTASMQSFLKHTIDAVGFPESFLQPFDEIDRLVKLYRGRGAGTKVSLANTLIHRCGFSLAEAAAHPACHSAAYFQRKLIEAAQNR